MVFQHQVYLVWIYNRQATQQSRQVFHVAPWGASDPETCCIALEIYKSKYICNERIIYLSLRNDLNDLNQTSCTCKHQQFLTLSCQHANIEKYCKINVNNFSLIFLQLFSIKIFTKLYTVASYCTVAVMLL